MTAAFSEIGREWGGSEEGSSTSSSGTRSESLGMEEGEFFDEMEF